MVLYIHTRNLFLEKPVYRSINSNIIVILCEFKNFKNSRIYGGIKPRIFMMIEAGIDMTWMGVLH